MIAVSLVLTLVGAALFVVSLFRSDDLNIVLLCIGCALLAAVFLGVGALRSRPSRKPVLASGARDQAPDARPPARQPAAGATSLSVLERDEEPPGWAPPVGTGGSRQETPQPPDDTSWRRPKTTPAPSRPVAEELPAEEFVEDELPEDEVVDDPSEEFIEAPPLVKPARTTPAKPRATAARSGAAKAGAAKVTAAKAGAARSGAAKVATAKATAAKVPTAKATAAKVTAAKAAKATSPARAGKATSGAVRAAKTTRAAKAAKAAKAAPASSPARTAQAKATRPAKAVTGASPARARSLPPTAKKAQAEAVEIGLSARDAARVEDVLGPVSGLGPAKRAQLLRFFGTWRRLRNASVERLAEVPGITPALAERIRAALDE